MKTVLTAALMVVMAGVLLMCRTGPIAFGQKPEFPSTPAMERGVFVQTNPQSHSIELAKEYAKATRDDVKKELKKQLSDFLNREFDQLAQRQQAELDNLEKQVADLKAVLKKRKESKDTIIERRLDQLILDAEGLGWGSPKQSNTSPYYPAPASEARPARP